MNKIKIAVIGLGYVGLPLAISLSQKFDVTGFDSSRSRIQDLKKGIDKTCEVSKKQLQNSDINLTFDVHQLTDPNFYIVTVPTPVDEARTPDMAILEDVCNILSLKICPGDIVVLESTVYPGVTEDICAPILENGSAMILNQDFYIGYSPERISPGDKNRTLDKITKVVSGSNKYALDVIDGVYSQIITAGTHRASSIKVAESAKVIENVQRDVNIALINELSEIFSIQNIDTTAVLEAAATKWNFHTYKPGLVGGHCIGVDPYYLKYYAEKHGMITQMIASGRVVNDAMAAKVGQRFVKKMCKAGAILKGANILVAGITFKENCPDVRNSKVFDLVSELEDFGCNVTITDPHADPTLVMKEYGRAILNDFKNTKYDGIILAVGHDEYLELGADFFNSKCRDMGIFLDLKSVFAIEETNMRL